MHSERSPAGSTIGSAGTIDREVAHRGVLRLTFLTLLSNIFLTVIKGVTGFVAGSHSLISDAMNSASDCFFGIVVLVGVRISGKQADESHPYGYERFESLVTMFLGAVVTMAGLFIGFDGARKIYSALTTTHKLEAPEPVALWVAGGVIIFKIFMYVFTKARARKYRSDILAAAAADHGADALATSGVFIGIGAAQLGWPIMDPLASLVIAVLIVRTGIGIISKAVGQVTDKSAGPEIDARIADVIKQHHEVSSIDSVMSRVFGDRIYVDIEISLPGDYSITKAHDIAEHIHTDVETAIPEVKDCMVHVNPEGSSDSTGEKIVRMSPEVLD